MRLILFVAITVGTMASVSRAEDLVVTVMRDRAAVSVPHPDKIADLVVALVESSSVNSTAYVRLSGRWRKALRASTLIRARFGHPRVMRVMSPDNQEWRLVEVREILIAIPRENWPDHVLLKTRDRMVSVTKYAPCALAHVVTEAGLKLSDVPRYKELLDACGGGN